MFVSEAGTRKENGGEGRVPDVYGKARRDQLRFSRAQGDGGFEACPKIKSCGTIRCIFRKRDFFAQAGIKNLELDVLHDSERR